MAVIFSSVAAEVAVGVATCLVVVYLYFANAFRYWKKRSVHHVQPSSVFGNFGSVLMQKEHTAELLKRIYDDNPSQKVVGLFAMAKPILMVRDLDIVRCVMVKDARFFLDRSIDSSEDSDPLRSRTLLVLKGDKWRHMRVKLTPTFSSGKIKKMFYLINESGKQLLPCIEQEMLKGKCVVKDTVARYSTDVIASCAFGIDANAIADPNSEFSTSVKKLFQISAIKRFFLMLSILLPRVVKFFGLKTLDEDINNYFRKTFWDVVDYRKKNGIVRKDFVDILMQLKEKGEVQAEEANDEEIKQKSKHADVGDATNGQQTDIKLQDDDFVAQAFIFIAAGFETSSSVITFTLFELALNPDVQDKLRKKILEVLDKHNSEVTYDAIAEMSYLEMVISETMRKYPTLAFLERKCLSDYKIPETDITVEKGTSVMIPLLGIHLDHTIYPNPDKFEPERFSPENKRKRSNFAHMPFGEGPRICIGMRFGQMQVKTALVHILTTYKVKPCPETPIPPLGMKPIGAINIPKKSIVLAFEKIK